MSVAWSADGRWLASGSANRTVRLWDPASGAERRRCTGHEDMVYSVAWSADGRWLASGSGDCTVRLWDPASGAEQRRCTGHNGGVSSVAWSADGRWLASGSGDCTVRLWDPASGAEQRRCTGHADVVISMAWSADGRWLASGSEDRTVRLWDPASGQEVALIGRHAGTVWAVAFSPDGTCLASASSDGTVALWDVADLVQPRARPTAAGPVRLWLQRQAATVGRRAVVISGSRELWVPHLPGADVEGCLGVLRQGSDINAPGIALSADGRTLVSGHDDGRLRCWDLTTGQLRWESRERDEDLILDVAWSADGRGLASGSLDGMVRLWDPTSGAERRRCTGHEDGVRSVAWSPDGRWLASGSKDRTVRLWDPTSGAEIRRCTRHQNWVNSVAWSPDGQWLASGSDDGTVRLWDPASGAERLRCTGHWHWVYSVAWSADGRWLASGSDDGTVRLWDPTSGAERRRCTGHEDRVRSVAWSADGRWLASGSTGCTMRLWDPTTGQEVRRFTFPDEEKGVRRLAWSPNSAFLISTHGKETIRFWDTRHLVAQTPAVSAPMARPLPPDLAPLPGVLAALHRLNIHPPLSLLRDLRDLLGGLPAGEALHALAQHPGIRQLIHLHWPGPARTGLLALLLRQLTGGDWQRPAELSPSDLIPALTQALSGEAIEPQAPAPPLALLSQAADTLDDRLLTLLSALGPQALTADPGLVLRLLPQVHTLPPLAERQRRLLGQSLTPLHAGPAQGSGLGQDRTGIAPRGPITALVPSQLAYPWDLLAWRCENGGLLYRTRTGQEPPHYRPTVILLDISPPCFGPIEALTRPAAHALASTLHRHRIPVILLAAGGPATVHLLDQPTDLLQLFTLRTRKSVPTAETLAKAQALCHSLQGHDRPPLILLLTHPWWGADAPHLPAPPHLRALFVQYPGKPVHPLWAERCERWETIGPEQGERLTQVLGRLIG